MIKMSFHDHFIFCSQIFKSGGVSRFGVLEGMGIRAGLFQHWSTCRNGRKSWQSLFKTMKHRWFHGHKLLIFTYFSNSLYSICFYFFSILLGHNKNQQTWIWICFLNDATAVHRCHPLFGSKCGISVLIGLRSQQRPKSAGHAMVDATEQIVLWNLRYFFQKMGDMDMDFIFHIMS